MSRWISCLFVVLLLTPLAADAAQFKPGDEVWVTRKFAGIRYHHAGVYLGKGLIVHVSGNIPSAAKRLLKGGKLVTIVKTSLGAFAKGGTMKLGPTRLRYKRAVVVKRALRKVGRAFRYFLPTNNCQHFTSRVVSGSARSPEVNIHIRVAKAALLKALKKVGQAFTGKNNVRVTIKNCAKKKVYVCVYNGGDKARTIAKKRISLRKGQSRQIQCAGNGKRRCQVKLSKRRSCSVFLKTHKVYRNNRRYVYYKKGKFRLSSRCR